VELARAGAGRTDGGGAERDRAGAEREDVLATGTEAVDPVLAVAVRDDDVAVGRLHCVGRSVERRAWRTDLVPGAERHQHLAGRRMLGDDVVAGIGVEKLVVLVHPEAVRRTGEVAPGADL